MRKTFQALTFSVAIACFSSAQADPIALNFYWSSGQQVSSTVDGISNWQNFQIGDPRTTRSTISLADGAEFWYTTTSYWQPNISGSLNPLYRATMDVSYRTGVISGNSSVIQFLELDSWMQANNYGSYDLVLYTAAYAGTAPILPDFDLYAGDFTSTTDGSTLPVPLESITPSLLQDAGTGRWFARDVVAGLTEVDLMITSEKMPYANSGGRGGIAAIALVGNVVPEPASATLGLFGVSTLLFFLRRRQG